MEKSTQNDEQVLEVKSREFTSKKLFWLVTLVCFAWSVFQLYIAYFTLNTNIARSIHLAFAIFIIFSLFPFRPRSKAHFYIPFYDYILLIVGVAAILYPAIEFNGLA